MSACCGGTEGGAPPHYFPPPRSAGEDEGGGQGVWHQRFLVPNQMSSYSFTARGALFLVLCAIDSIRCVSIMGFFSGSRMMPMGSRPCCTFFISRSITSRSMITPRSLLVRRSRVRSAIGTLSLPCHVVLSLDRIHAEFCVRVQRIRRILVGLVCVPPADRRFR